MSDSGKKTVRNGTQRTLRGKPCVYYDGYWIRRYDYSKGTLSDKKQIIDVLTRRVFHHVEPGINTPGHRLDMIRNHYAAEQDPARKRVKGAMLAGALLNRGRDILTHLVDLEQQGVAINVDNELLVMCGDCFTEAIELGRNIRLASGEEGLEELWGEPFRVFSLPAEDFYRGRYIKLAQTMSQIDSLTGTMQRIVASGPPLRPASALLKSLCKSAKEACETLRSDPENFTIWPEFVACKEAFDSFRPIFPVAFSKSRLARCHAALQLLHEGGLILSQLVMVRVAMPVSVENFLNKSEDFFAS